MANVLCLGDVGIDFYKNNNQHFLGGCAYNLHFHLNSLGIENTLMAPLGDDQWTAEIQSKAQNSIFLKRSRENLFLEIRNDPNGEKSYGCFKSELIEDFTWEDQMLDQIGQYSTIVSPYYEEIRAFINPVIERFGKRMILDLHEQKKLTQSDLILFSKTLKGLHIGVKAYPDEFYLELSNSLEFISITLGAAGSELFVMGRKYSSKCIELEVMDSTGAGDAYLAYLVAHVMRDALNFDDIPELLSKCHCFASKVLKLFGATDGFLLV